MTIPRIPRIPRVPLVAVPLRLALSVVVAAAATLAAPLGWAQTAPRPAMQASSASPAPPPAASRAAAPAPRGNPNPTASAVAGFDLSLAARALQLGLAEVATGSLAQQRATDDAVRRFGRRMVEEHGRANAELLQWAQQRRVALPQRLDPPAQAELDQLAGLSGKAFDRTYMSRMVTDHQLAIAHFESMAQTGGDAALKAWALRKLPTLRAHLASAQATHVAVNHVRPGQVRADEAAAAPASRDLRTSRLLGKPVLGVAGENVGRLEDLVVDVHDERVHYAVLSFGGAMGVGDKHFAFPMSAFRLAANGESLLLPGVSPAQLQQAPGFDRDRWPDWNAPGYAGEVARFHGADPRVAPRPGARLVRASWLMGKHVDDRTGAGAGEVEDLVVDLATSRLHYVVIEFDPGWLSGERLLPLPVRALVLPRDPGADLVLAVPRARVERQLRWNEDRWPDLNDPAFKRKVDDSLHRFPGLMPVLRQ